MVRQVQAFQARDGKLFETAAQAKRHEAEQGLMAIFSDPSKGCPWSETDPMANAVAYVLDNAEVIAPLLADMVRADIRPYAVRIEERPKGDVEHILESQP